MKRPTEGKPVAPNDKKHAPYVEEDLWVDFIEDELDEAFEEDLSLLLMNSQSDKRNMTNIKALRDLIKRSDDVYLPEDGRVYDRMHANIMSAIADKRPGSEPNFARGSYGTASSSSFMKRFKSNRFSSFAGATALSALLAVVGWFSLNKQVSPEELQASRNLQVESQMLAASVETPSISADVLNVSNDDEFVVDAASRKIASMSDQDYQALIQHLRK